MASFGAWDYTVLATILVVSTAIGIYYRLSGGKQKTTHEYLMGGQSMSVVSVAFSLMASFMSSISLMGVSNESYQFGMMFCAINFAYIIGTPLAAYIFLPVFYRMRTTSVYEYLERRFGYRMRLAASLCFTAQMVLYMGIVLYAPALALEAVTGISYVTAIFAIGLVCTLYSTLGGLKAVVITDVFQSLLMFAAIYVVIIISVIKAGGITPIWENAHSTGRLDLTEVTLDPTVRHSWWSLVFGGLVTYLSLYGVNQTQVQRLLSVRNLKSSQSSLWWSLPILMCLSFSTLFAGLAIFYYYRGCDPVLSGRIKTRDQLMPLFAIDTMGQYPGLCGLFVSGIFSASLSTVSSSVSSLSAVTLEDYFKPLYKKIFKKSIIESKTILPTKIIACLYGFVCIGLAFAASSMGGVLQASLTIFGVVGGPLLAVFTLGICTARANQRGVMAGFFLGLLFGIWIGFGGPKPPPSSLPLSNVDCVINNSTLATASLSIAAEIAHTTIAVGEQSLAGATHYFWLYRISYMWYSVICCGITLIFGYLFSRVFERYGWANNSQIYLDSECTEVDSDLFLPALSRKLNRHTNNFELEKLSSVNYNSN